MVQRFHLAGRSVVFSKQSLLVVFSVVTAFTLTFVLAAQDNTNAQEKKKEWKDRAEYDLADAAQKDTNPTTRLATLQKWQQQYAQSDFAFNRKDMILTTYQQLMQNRQAIAAAQDMLKDQPNNFHALLAVVAAVEATKPPTPADLDLLEKTASYVIANFDQVFAKTNKPDTMTEPQWDQAKNGTKPYAEQALDFVYMTRRDQTKDYARAQADLTKMLQADSTFAKASYDLADTILKQAKEKPEQQPLALYEYARAASYDGPNALPPADRTSVKAYLTKVYPTYHGSNEGLDQLLASAKNSALPPADFKIKSTADIAQEEAAKAAADAAANPMLNMWVKTLKENLTGPMGDSFWDMTVKDAGLPGGVNGVNKFKGKIVSMEPATRPKEIDLAIEKPGVVDAKLTLDMPLPGKMEAGEELEFSGAAKSYTKEPFSITFEVTKDDISGWTGKNTPGAKKAAPGTKTGAAKKKQ